MDKLNRILIISITFSIVEAEYISPRVFVRFNGNGKDLAGTLEDPFIRSDVVFSSGPFDESDEGCMDLSNIGTTADGAVISYDVPGGSIFTTDYTVSLWVNNVNGEIGYIVGFTDGVDIPGFDLFHRNSDTQLRIRNFLVNGGGDDQKFLDNMLPRNTWVHIVVTYDSTAKLQRVFKDSMQVYKRSVTYSKNFLTGPKMRLSRRYPSQDVIFRGQISCLQIYDVALDQRQISQSTSLCKPEYHALNPWPVHLGLWVLDSFYSSKDAKRSDQLCDGTMDDGIQYRSPGPDFSANNSYEFRPEGPSYLEFTNTNNHVSPKNSLTYSALIYHQDAESYPIFQYEYGTEVSGTNNWALNIWVLSNKIYICVSGSTCISSVLGTVISNQWNFVALSYDWVKAEITFYVNDDKETLSYNTNEATCDTERTTKIRLGRNFFDGEERFMSGRVSCIQMFDVNLNTEEIYRLKHTCEDKHRARIGEPNGLVLMHPFNAMSKCRTVVPKFGHHLTDQDGSMANCQLVKGYRKRPKESVRIEQSTYLTGSAVLPEDSSFTLMAYIHLKDNGVTIQFDSGPSFSLNHNGTFTATLTQTSNSKQVFDVYDETWSNWVHLAVACNSDSGACYVFGNSSYVGMIFLSPSETLATNNRMIAEASSGSIDIQCLQLYNRHLAQYEIEKAASSCYKPANERQLPLPAGFWPLDKKYKTRELTSRNLPIVLTDTSNVCEWLNDSPLGSNQGSLYLDTSITQTCQGTIAPNSASDVRHSFTIAAMVKVAAKSIQSGSNPTYVFSFLISEATRGFKFQISHADTDTPKTHTRIWSKKTREAYSSYTRIPIEHEKWYQCVFTCDYATGRCEHIVDRTTIRRKRIDYRDALTTYPIRIGRPDSFKIQVTCIQLYDEALSDVQLKRAQEMCDYSKTDVSSYFMRLEEVPAGYGRISANSTVSVRSRIACIEKCMTSDECFSISYHPSQKTCKLSSLFYEEETGLTAFEHSGEDYLEFIHPLIAEAY